MKNLLIIPMFFVYYIGMAQNAITTDSAFIIGESIRVGINLVVAQYDFPKVMDFRNAEQACYKLGKGWRLPSKDELNSLYLSKDKIGGFVDNDYWSSTETHYNSSAWVQNFSDGSKVDYDDKYVRCHVRAVRAF